MTYQPKTDKQRYWAIRLEEAEASGLSLAEYARENNLHTQALYQWRSTLRSRAREQAVTTHHFTQAVTTYAPPCCALHIDSHTLQLRFDELPDAHWLSTLINAQNSSS